MFPLAIDLRGDINERNLTESSQVAQRARQRVRGSRELEGAATFAGEILKVKWGDVEWTAEVQSLNTVNSFPNSDVVQTPDRGPRGKGRLHDNEGG